jgi:hypothetical protein
MTISSNTIFTLRGNLTQSASGAHITGGAGSIWEFDSSRAYDAANVHYFAIPGNTNVNNDTQAHVTFTGTSSTHAIIRSNAGGGNGYFTMNGGMNNSGILYLTYVDMLRIGYAGAYAITSRCNFMSNCGSMDHVVMDTTGGMSFNFRSQPYTMADTTWKNTIGAIQLRAPTTGTSTLALTRTVFDTVAVVDSNGLTVDGSVFLRGYVIGASGHPKAVSLSNSFVRSAAGNASLLDGGTGQISRGGDWSNIYQFNDCSVFDNAGHYSNKQWCENPHWNTPGGVGNGTFVVTQSVFDDGGSGGDGDVDYAASPSTGLVSQWTYNLGLPSDGNPPATGAGTTANPGGNGLSIGTYGLTGNSNRSDTGTMTTHNGWNGDASVYDHNTWFAGVQTPMALVEQGTGYANMITSLRENLFWNDATYLGGATPTTGTCSGSANWKSKYTSGVACSSIATVTQDVITPSTCDYNGSWNMFTQPGYSSQPGYQINESGSGCGVHDLADADPQFTDATRRLWSWAQSISGGVLPGNASPDHQDWQAWGLYLLSLQNSPSDPNYNASATIANLLSWVKAGYSPSCSSTYANAGHDSSTIGAVACH